MHNWQIILAVFIGLAALVCLGCGIGCVLTSRRKSQSSPLESSYSLYCGYEPLNAGVDPAGPEGDATITFERLPLPRHKREGE